MIGDRTSVVGLPAESLPVRLMCRVTGVGGLVWWVAMRGLPWRLRCWLWPVFTCRLGVWVWPPHDHTQAVRVRLYPSRDDQLQLDEPEVYPWVVDAAAGLVDRPFTLYEVTPAGPRLLVHKHQPKIVREPFPAEQEKQA